MAKSIMFFAMSFLWIYLYIRARVVATVPIKKVHYFGFSLFGFLLVAAMIIGGIRGGDFSKSTRPINLVDASKHVKKVSHADIVLNTPFAIIRTLFSNNFKKTNFPEVTPRVITEMFEPIKQYDNHTE